VVSTHAYCPRCQEDSAINAERHCLWCDHPVDQQVRGKKPNLTRNQLEVIYRLCTERNVPLVEIAKSSYRKWGYSSATSCNASISSGFKKAGFPCLWEARKNNKKLKELIHS
jgi:hypothetical protein